MFAYPQEDKALQKVPAKPITEDEYTARIKNYDHRYKKMEKHLSKKIPKTLDVGCQNGVFLSYMKKKGCITLGVEPSEEYTEFATRMFGINVINGIFERQTIKQRFDLITMFNVLEHTKNPREALIKAFEILEKGGLLVLELPYIFTLQSVLSLGYWHHFQKDHNWFFNKKNIKELLEELGFNVDAISFIAKIAPLSTILDALLSRTVYMRITRESYLRFRESFFYKMLNRVKIKVNIMDYLLVIATKP